MSEMKVTLHICDSCHIEVRDERSLGGWREVSVRLPWEESDPFAAKIGGVASIKHYCEICWTPIGEELNRKRG